MFSRILRNTWQFSALFAHKYLKVSCNPDFWLSLGHQNMPMSIRAFVFTKTFFFSTAFLQFIEPLLMKCLSASLMLWSSSSLLHWCIRNNTLDLLSNHNVDDEHRDAGGGGELYLWRYSTPDTTHKLKHVTYQLIPSAARYVTGSTFCIPWRHCWSSPPPSTPFCLSLNAS